MSEHNHGVGSPGIIESVGSDVVVSRITSENATIKKNHHTVRKNGTDLGTNFDRPKSLYHKILPGRR
jgi:hypothetical protein